MFWLRSQRHRPPSIGNSKIAVVTSPLIVLACLGVFVPTVSVGLNGAHHFVLLGGAMASLRATNYLLLVIAICLVALAGKQALLTILPAANAQTPTLHGAKLYACQQEPYTYPGNCNWKPLLVDGKGQLIVAK